MQPPRPIENLWNAKERAIFPDRYKDFEGLLKKLKTECEGKYKGINDIAEEPAGENGGLAKLTKLIHDNLEVVLPKKGVAKGDIPAIKAVIQDYMTLWPQFQQREDQVVETWVEIWAYRPDKKLKWYLKVIWDADWPDPATGILPHYGYEIYLDNQRVAGPGHVYFTKSGPSYYRDGEPMHEVNRSRYLDQGMGGLKGTQKPVELELRLDYSWRLWSLGANKDVPAGFSMAQYNQEFHDLRVPVAFERPCFGLPVEEAVE